MTTSIVRPGRIRATVRVPSDKSISHRALIFNAIAEGAARVERLLDSEDVRSTAACLRALGVTIDWPAGGAEAVVTGAGLHGLRESADILDCGNSGTTMRLLSGLLAGQPMLSVLSGDGSLRSRPMRRVIAPLRAMGATLLGRADDTLPPLVVRGGGLTGQVYASPVASAQVKSAILLAGLFAEGGTTVTEPAPSRDHSERMLSAMGAPIRTDGASVTVSRPNRLDAVSLRVPGDISSAAPWLVLGACHSDAEILIEGVNVNPTRTGLLDVMQAMGAHVEVLEERLSGGEPVADLRVRSSQLHGTTVEGAVVPRMIDEIPLVAVLACFADGETVVRDAAELRVKESDRIDAVAASLAALGVAIEPAEDGFVVHGKQELRGGTVDGGGDHRIGMLGGIAGALADGETRVVNDAVGVSYPTFWRDLDAIAGASVAQ